MQTEVTILGGLKVTVEFNVCGSDPEVGIMSAYVEDWSIVEIAGRPLRKNEKADWLYRRIEATKGTEDKIIEACNEAIDNYEPDYEPDYEYDY